MKKLGLLDRLAEQHRTFISNLRLQPTLKWEALGDLYQSGEQRAVPAEGVGRSCVLPAGLRGAVCQL